MDILSYIISDHIMFPLIESVIAFVFLFTIYKQTMIKIRPKGIPYSIKRGEKGWSRLLASYGISIILVEIIVSSNLIPNHKVIIGLLNVGVLIYLNLFSPYFRNKLIGWSSKIMDKEETL